MKKLYTIKFFILLIVFTTAFSAISIQSENLKNKENENLLEEVNIENEMVDVPNSEENSVFADDFHEDEAEEVMSDEDSILNIIDNIAKPLESVEIVGEEPVQTVVNISDFVEVVNSAENSGEKIYSLSSDILVPNMAKDSRASNVDYYYKMDDLVTTDGNLDIYEKWGIATKFYTEANLQARAWVDDNISHIHVPARSTVTLHDKDRNATLFIYNSLYSTWHINLGTAVDGRFDKAVDEMQLITDRNMIVYGQVAGEEGYVLSATPFIWPTKSNNVCNIPYGTEYGRVYSRVERNVNPLSVYADLSQVNCQVEGQYPVKFFRNPIGNIDTFVTIKDPVNSDLSYFDSLDDNVTKASDFFVEDRFVNNLSESKIKEWSNSQSFWVDKVFADTIGRENPVYKLENSNLEESIKSKPGPYKLGFIATPNEFVPETGHIQFFGNVFNKVTTAYSTSTFEAIDAKDIEMDSLELRDLTNAQKRVLIDKKSNPKGWHGKTGEELSLIISEEELSLLTTEVGTYYATYTTASGVVKRKIKITVAPTRISTEFTAIQEYALNSSVSEKQFTKDIKLKVNGSTDLRNYTITTDLLQVVDFSKKDVYSVKMKIEDDFQGVADIVIKVVIGAPQITQNNYSIHANNIITTEAYMNGSGESLQQFLINESGAVGWNKTTNELKGVTATRQGSAPLTGPFVEFIKYNITGVSNAPVINKTLAIKSQNSIVNLKNNEMVDAKNVTIDIKNVDNSNFIALSNAQAWNLDTSSKIGLTVKNSIPNKVGVHDLSLKTANGSEKIIKVIVKDDNTIINSETREMIQAEKFSVELNDVNNLNYLAAANARAWNIDTGNEIVLGDVLKGNRPTAIGVYSVDFKTSLNTTKSVKYIVKDNTVTIDTKKEEMISAVNFEVELKDINDINFVTMSQAIAWNTATGEMIGVLQSGAKPTKIGVHAVRLKTAKNTEKIIYVAVKDSTTVINNINDEMISGINFEIDLKDVSSANFLEYGQLEAWKLSDGSSVEVAMVGNKPKSVGTYLIDFKTIKGTKKTINVIVKDKNSVLNPIDNEMLIASNFHVNIEDINVNNLLELGNVRAWDTITMQIIPVRVFSELPTTIGVHQIEFGTLTDKTKIVVFMSVTDDSTVINVINDEMIRASNFTLKLSEVQKTNFSEAAGGQAWKMSSGTSEIVSYNSIKPIDIGVYPIIIETNKHTQKIVYATIIDERTVVNENNGEMISANSFAVNLDDISSTDFIVASNARAWKMSDSSGLEVAYKGTKPEKIGVYGTVFETMKKSQVETFIKVVDESVIIDNKIGEMISAKNFEIELSEIENSNFLELGDVQAWRLSDGSDVAVSIKSSIPTEVGVYKTIFETENGLEKVVITTVVDSNTIIDTNTQEMIWAQNFVVQLKDVNTTDFVDASAARAWKLNDASRIWVGLKSQKPTEIGVYPIEFATLNGARIKVFVTIKDETTIIDPENNELISAQNFDLDLKEIEGADFVALSNARAWNTLDGSEVMVTLKSEKPVEPGIYDLVYGTENNTNITIIVKVLSEFINANNFEITLDEWNIANDSNNILDIVVGKSNAIATDAITGERVEIVEVKNIDDVNNIGIYRIELLTNKNEKEIEMTIIDHILEAEDFTITVRESNEITAEDILVRSSANTKLVYPTSNLFKGKSNFQSFNKSILSINRDYSHLEDVNMIEVNQQGIQEIIEIQNDAIIPLELSIGNKMEVVNVTIKYVAEEDLNNNSNNGNILGNSGLLTSKYLYLICTLFILVYWKFLSKL